MISPPAESSSVQFQVLAPVCIGQEPLPDMSFLNTDIFGNPHEPVIFHDIGMELGTELEDGTDESTTPPVLDPNLRPAAQSSARLLGREVPPTKGGELTEDASISNGASLTANTRRESAVARLKPLHICSGLGNHAILQILLQGGADINATDKLGRTALHHAVENGHEEVVSLLLKHRANPTILDHVGTSVMQLAVSKNQQSIVILLLQKGISPDF